MPISATGNKWGRRPRLQRVSRPAGFRGVTLMEMMVVLAIIALIVGISFPSTIAGLENVRLFAVLPGVPVDIRVLPGIQRNVFP